MLITWIACDASPNWREALRFCVRKLLTSVLVEVTTVTVVLTGNDRASYTSCAVAYNQIWSENADRPGGSTVDATFVVEYACIVKGATKVDCVYENMYRRGYAETSPATQPVDTILNAVDSASPLDGDADTLPPFGDARIVTYVAPILVIDDALTETNFAPIPEVILLVDVPCTVAYNANITFVELENDKPDNNMLMASPLDRYPCGNSLEVGDRVSSS